MILLNTDVSFLGLVTSPCSGSKWSAGGAVSSTPPAADALPSALVSTADPLSYMNKPQLPVNKTKDVKSKKVSSLRAAKASSGELKKTTAATVYEEIDIFASVRSQQIEKAAKRRKRRASAASSKEMELEKCTG